MTLKSDFYLEKTFQGLNWDSKTKCQRTGYDVERKIFQILDQCCRTLL